MPDTQSAKKPENRTENQEEKLKVIYSEQKKMSFLFTDFSLAIKATQRSFSIDSLLKRRERKWDFFSARSIEANSPTLYKGYELKEEIRQISHMSDVKSAEAELDRFLEKARNTGLPAFVKLAEKIVRHRENLLNTIRYGANRSLSESCNAKMKRIIRRAHGFRNLDNLSAMIYLECKGPGYPPASQASFHRRTDCRKPSLGKRIQTKKRGVQ